MKSKVVFTLAVSCLFSVINAQLRANSNSDVMISHSVKVTVSVSETISGTVLCNEADATVTLKA